jgi:hypothetical protein
MHAQSQVFRTAVQLPECRCVYRGTRENLRDLTGDLRQFILKPRQVAVHGLTGRRRIVTAASGGTATSAAGRSGSRVLHTQSSTAQIPAKQTPHPCLISLLLRVVIGSQFKAQTIVRTALDRARPHGDVQKRWMRGMWPAHRAQRYVFGFQRADRA